jgi:hypothetical protein
VSQTKRSHVLARVRWREQAARLVALAVYPGRETDGCARCKGSGVEPVGGPCFVCGGLHGFRFIAVIIQALLDGSPFDVSLVRTHCERLIAEGECRALDRVVFADWTRDRGLGPENRKPGAFVLSDADLSIALSPGLRRGRGMRSSSALTIMELRRRRRGGWPGRLARDYGWEPCEVCGGKGRAERRTPEGDLVWIGPKYERCAACRGRARTRKAGITLGFVAGPGIARTAQRLLETLDGRCPWSPEAKVQSGTCGSCRGSRFMLEGVRRAVIDSMTASALQRYPDLPVREALDLENRVAGLACNDCRGTGHNLAGVLPPVEPPAAEHRKVHDSAGSARFEDHPEAWTFGRDYEGTLLTSQREHGGCACTRSVPRGQHRSNDDLGTGFAVGQGSTLDERITAKGWQPSPWWRPFGMSDSRSAPRWRRGELRHAQRMRVG